MRKEEIYLDLSKLTEQEIKDVSFILENNNEPIFEKALEDLIQGNKDSLFSNLHFNIEEQRWLRCSSGAGKNQITFQQFKDLFTFKEVSSQDVRNTEEELFKDLTIGQEIEVNGYVLKVEREVSQWYVNKDTMKFIKSNYQPYGASLVTDKDFINQLEKFSK